MNSFRLFNNPEHWTEATFKSHYGADVIEEKMRCCSGMPEEDWCTNDCRYLLVEGGRHVADDGTFPIFGIACDVDVLCWGGDDVRNSTIEVYCKQCASARHEFLVEQERRNGSDLKQVVPTQIKQSPTNASSVDFWESLSPIAFEYECARLFRRLNYYTELTPTTNDGGIDLLLEKDGKRGAVQCKARRKPCGVRDVRELYGAIAAEGLHYGILVSKSGFTKSALVLIERTQNGKTQKLEGWDIKNLIHSIGENDEL